MHLQTVKKRRKENIGLGEPKFNLTIELECQRRKEVFVFKTLEEIETYSLAIHCLKMLRGRWYVTETGDMIRWQVEGLPEKKAVVRISDNIQNFRPKKVIPIGRKKDNHQNLSIFLRHEDNQLEEVTYSKRGFFLPAIRFQKQINDDLAQLLASA